MTHLLTTQMQHHLAVRLTELRDANLEQANAIALDTGNRVTGRIEATRNADGVVLAPLARRMPASRGSKWDIRTPTPPLHRRAIRRRC